MYYIVYGVVVLLRMFAIQHVCICITLAGTITYRYEYNTIHGMLSSLGICIIYSIVHILYIYRVMIAYRV